MYGQYCKLHRVLLAHLVLIKLYYLIIGSIGSKNRTVHYKALSSSIIWIIGVIFHFAGIDMAWSWSKQFVVCVLQGVPQYCFHFCFINFSASKASKSSILDIFQQSFQCRFWTIKYAIIWCNFDWDIARILKGSHLKNQHFLFITESRTWTLRIIKKY